MPCHVDEILPRMDRNEIAKVVEVVKGKIKIKDVGDSFHGKYPTVGVLVREARTKHKTFSYKVHGTLFVLVSPCPKRC